MPIYEFYCSDCNTIFNFFSRTVNTMKLPICPRCKKRKLQRQVSLFAATRQAKEDSGGDLPFDEPKMEKAMESLAQEAEGINEDDPKQAARLMRKFTGMTGMKLGKGMEEAMNRLESGDDPEKIESEMGDLMESEEEPFILPGKEGKGLKSKETGKPPVRDNTLYEMWTTDRCLGLNAYAYAMLSTIVPLVAIAIAMIIAYELQGVSGAVVISLHYKLTAILPLLK